MLTARDIEWIYLLGMALRFDSPSMSFTAKVKKDGRLFLAGIERGIDTSDFRDAHLPLDKEKIYIGNILESSVGNSPYVGWSGIGTDQFSGEELEEEAGDIRLISF